MHRITARILDVSNTFQNANFPIHEIVCVSPPPYYLDWFEISYLNVPLNLDGDQFRLRHMNEIQGTNIERRQWNKILNALLTLLKHQKITIDHAIYIEVFYDGNSYYLRVTTDDFLNDTNTETAFTEPIKVFQEESEINI